MPVRLHVKTIADYHRLRHLPAPEHPLISVTKFEAVVHDAVRFPKSLILDFFSIALKRNFNGKMKYGQQYFDFDEGLMHFMSPRQVLSIEPNAGQDMKPQGWLLLVHPDFLWNTALARKIKQYEYFDYKVSEALHLSEKEELVIDGIIKSIEQEYHTSIDRHSHEVIIAQLELLLTYSERFYQRQFNTRRIANHEVLSRLEALLSDHFNNDKLVSDGIPSVDYFADALNLSSNYLSRLLKTLTGQSTKQFIHDKLIEKAKEKLSVTDLSVAEIAYELGFEHPQSFSKLFKAKTDLTPLAFRQSVDGGRNR